MVKLDNKQTQSFMWVIWLIGWLFTIGFLHLTVLKSVLAIVIWPYYIGTHFAGL